MIQGTISKQKIQLFLWDSSGQVAMELKGTSKFFSSMIRKGCMEEVALSKTLRERQAGFAVGKGIPERGKSMDKAQRQ